MKTIKWIQGTGFIVLLFLNACADRVAFSTHTVYGLDVDTQPTPTFSLGLDRSELVVGPRYDNGAVPPVVASIKVNGGLFNTGISQVYATGIAADRVTQDNPPATTKLPLKGGKKTMVFGTHTNLGIKATFVDQIPKSFNFGYKRQELSIIPVGNDGDVDTYASVLAAVDTDAQVKTLTGVENGYTAYLATGAAAKTMAGKQAIKDIFDNEAAQSFSSYSAYGGGISGTKLRKFWKPDGKTVDSANEAKIKAWMKQNGLRTDPGDLTVFLSNTMFMDARDQAVKDLNIN